MSLRERLIALANPAEYDNCADIAIAAARMALEEAVGACADEEIYPDERWGGIYNVAVQCCATAIHSLRDGLE